MGNKRIDIIVPCYNEEQNIEAFYSEVQAVATQIKKIDMQGLNIQAKGEMQGSAIDMQVKLTDTMNYSQYGEIDPKTYAIPADVTSAK